jgi:uncharacterized protein YhdP
MGSFTYDNYTWKPVQAGFLFAQDGASIEVTKADLCSLPTPAKIALSPEESRLTISLDARNLDLNHTVTCLWDRKDAITGTFDLDGKMVVKMQQPEMTEIFRGSFNLVARNGRVYRSTVLAKIFDLLNFTEIYRGQLPDLIHEGCAYDSIRASATLRKDKLLLDNAIFDGRCAKMVWTGEIDLTKHSLNFTVLVSPFKTVDRVIQHLPLIGRISGGSAVSIPVKVTGDLSDPKVIPLAPSAVGSSLLGFMERVFQLPFRLIQPLQ